LPSHKEAKNLLKKYRYKVDSKLFTVGKRSIATIGREKLQNINMNKKPLLQVDSSEVSGIHKFN
jgi:hypothetical protein